MQLRRYRIVLRAALAALALLIAVLTASTLLQGPRISSVQVSGEGVVERAGARMRLHLDHPIDTAVSGRISISPGAAFKASVVGSEITIEFTELLRYATEYTVSIADAETTTGRTSDLSTRFTTASPDLVTLVSSVDAQTPDRLMSYSLSGGESRVEFEASHIRSYAASGSVLAAVVDGGIQLIDRATGDRRSIVLPDGAEVSKIGGSTSAPTVAYTVTADGDGVDGGASTLFTLDASDPKSDPHPVTALDGAPIGIADWAFSPGSTSLAALSDEGELLRIEAGAEAPTSLGFTGQLRGFVPGTSDLLVADSSGGLVIDLNTAAQAPLELPPEVASSDSVSPPRLLDASSYLRTGGVSGGGIAGGESSAIILFDGYADRELFEPAAGTDIVRSCVSPNGQFVAVITAPVGSPRTTGPSPKATTAFVDIDTGSIAPVLDGASLEWC